MFNHSEVETREEKGWNCGDLQASLVSRTASKVNIDSTPGGRGTAMSPGQAFAPTMYDYARVVGLVVRPVS